MVNHHRTNMWDDLFLEPETSVYKWLFQLDDLESLHEEWLFYQTSISNWLFGVPGFAFLQASKSRKSKLRKHRWEGFAKISCVVLGNTLWFHQQKYGVVLFFPACYLCSYL